MRGSLDHRMSSGSHHLFAAQYSPFRVSHSAPCRLMCRNWARPALRISGIQYVHLAFCTRATRFRFASPPKHLLTFPPRIAEISAMSWVGTTSWFLLPISTCMRQLQVFDMCQTGTMYMTPPRTPLGVRVDPGGGGSPSNSRALPLGCSCSSCAEHRRARTALVR